MDVRIIVLIIAFLAAQSACSDPAAPGPSPASTEHCSYEPVPATARAGGTVIAGAVEVGLASNPLELPVGTALGGNTSRARLIGNQGKVDDRESALSGGFTPSVGIETIPSAKAIAIRAGNERVVIVHTDSIFSDDTITFEVAARLGSDYAGKVIWASSHSHTAPEQYSADSKLQIGGGRKRGVVRDRMIEVITRTAREAIAAMEPAKIGIAVDRNFDPHDEVSYDRRPENDHLAGDRARKDSFLAVVRVDSRAGVTRAVIPIFGVHSAILDDDVSLFSTDVSGMYERILEEQFDHPVMVIHLQGAAGDVLATSESHVDLPRDVPQMDFAMSEANARRFLPQVMPVYAAAGADMKAELAMEMITRSVPLGPDWRTFTVRGGALQYAPFDGIRPADRQIFDDTGAILSPIDEFNAPYGAGLCGDTTHTLGEFLPDVMDLVPYNSCASIADAVQVLQLLVDAPFEPAPLCSSTRTTVSALRLGDYLFPTAPGEPLNLWADHVRELSPIAPDHTILLGYAQGHVGYLLTADDWLLGGFEPGINVWGPLEGEYVAERLADVMKLATTDAREDGAAGGTDRVTEPVISDPDVPPADPAPLAGTVPAVVPAVLYTRSGVVPATAQPAATIARVAGIARYVWIGEDPMAGTPRITLQREVAGRFVPVTRRSGRAVQDHDLVVTWTPDPLRLPRDHAPRTHYWAVEWQAVTWMGSTDGLTDALEDRPGVPLGRYRFHVEGTGYVLDSDPFRVSEGALAITAAQAGTQLTITAAYAAAPDDWRLLAAAGPSNRAVPVTRGALGVEVTTTNGGVERFELAVVSSPGRVVVTLPVNRVATAVRVFDRFGNVGTSTLTSVAALRARREPLPQRLAQPARDGARH